MYYVMVVAGSVLATGLLFWLGAHIVDKQLDDPVARKKIFDSLDRKYGS
jgi:hypothetical protein